MMRVQHDSGSYLRPAVESADEAEWLRDVLADWPVDRWGLRRCMDQVGHSAARISAQKLADKTEWNDVWWIWCDPAGVRLGTAKLTYNVGSNATGLDVELAAVHPDQRGKGHFSAMSDAIAWLANIYLAADTASYQVLHSAPQVAGRMNKRGAAVRVLDLPPAYEGAPAKDAVRMTLDEVRATWAEGEADSFSLVLE